MKKIISIILVAVMAFGCVSAFAGCVPEKDTNVLVMATNAAFPPYEYKEGEGYAGIDIEIAQEIAKKLNKELKIADIDFGAIIDGVQTGKYDFGMAGLTVTDERKEQVNFTKSYATGVQVIIVRADSPIQSLEDFYASFDEEGNPTALAEDNTDLFGSDGIKIGVQQDTTGDIYCSDDYTKWGFNTLDAEGNTKIDRVVRYKTGADAVEALKTGKVDAVIIDNEPAKSFVEANTDKNSGECPIKILESGEYVVEEYAICVSKGNTELLKQIDEALEQLKANGTIDRIIAKYINDGSSNENEENTEGGAE